MPTIDDLLREGVPPVVAILRGLRPAESVAIGEALYEGGIRMIEVPLNSTEPFASIAALVAVFGSVAAIGAGTVLDAPAADRLADMGATLMVTPNTDAEVISRGVSHGLEVMPGFLTPTEALEGLRAGARRLKLFPAGVLGPGYLKAVSAVLPVGTGVWAVGDIGSTNARQWLEAGAEGLGVGGTLYRPGTSPTEVRQKARELVAALHAET